jgi:hypothetical protein
MQVVTAAAAAAAAGSCRKQLQQSFIDLQNGQHIIQRPASTIAAV